MKVFISYRFSDIPVEELEKLINPVYNLLKTNKIDVFCNFYKDQYYINNNYTAKQIMDDCFEQLDERDTVLCLVDTDKHSCGMLLEMGYSIAKNRNILVCTREGCELDTLIAMATTNISYKDYDELLEKIEKLIH